MALEACPPTLAAGYPAPAAGLGRVAPAQAPTSGDADPRAERLLVAPYPRAAHGDGSPVLADGIQWGL